MMLEIFPANFAEARVTKREYKLKGGCEENVGMKYRINGGGLV